MALFSHFQKKPNRYWTPHRHYFLLASHQVLEGCAPTIKKANFYEEIMPLKHGLKAKEDVSI